MHDDPPDVHDDPPETRVAIIGRPNVGKSSLVNRLLREERVMVSDMPGTTRDAVDTVLRWHKRDFRIVDTAGMRRPGRVMRGGQMEQVSVILARRAIERADVVVLVVDATEGATDQDAAIAGEADRAGCGIIVAVNKWDLLKGQGAEGAKTVRREAASATSSSWTTPRSLHISARTGERTPKLLETIDRVGAARRHRVATSELNKFIEAVTAVHPPASPGAQARANPVRGPDRGRPADVRALHERRGEPALFLRAFSREPAARGVWIRGHAHPAARPTTGRGRGRRRRQSA